MGKGRMVFTRTGGKEDPRSPYDIELTGVRLKQGEHYSESFDSDIQLKDGSVYTIEFSGEDIAGNIAVNVSIENIFYDTSVPEIIVSNPESNGYYNPIILNYSLNEPLFSGKIRFEYTGGISDPMSPHVVDLAGNQLTAGQKTGIDIND
jgi:hypothetical protein